MGQLGGVILDSTQGHSGIKTGVIPRSFRSHFGVIPGFAVWIHRWLSASSAPAWRWHGLPDAPVVEIYRHEMYILGHSDIGQHPTDVVSDFGNVGSDVGQASTDIATDI